MKILFLHVLKIIRQMFHKRKKNILKFSVIFVFGTLVNDPGNKITFICKSEATARVKIRHVNKNTTTNYKVLPERLNRKCF